MSTSSYVLLTILLAGFSMWLAKVLPFLLLKRFTLPKWALEYLSFVPLNHHVGLMV